MKRLIYLVIFCLISTSGFAKRISQQTAYQTAQEFLKGKTIKEPARSLKSTSRIQSSKNLYIFNAENNEGFVIISGDDRTPAVLGYSDKGSIDLDSIPTNMLWLLESYESAIASLKDNDAPLPAKISEQTRSSDKENIEPLIMTHWGQDAPYYNHSPEYNGLKCKTGCVATAMAQIINYHQWPKEEISSIDSYSTTWNNMKVDALPSKRFNWSNMDDDENAWLMRYCGQSVKMNYTPSASAAFYDDVIPALINVFHFGKSMLWEKRADYSDEEWSNILYDQLANNMPILYGGTSDENGGHAFVIDGYENGSFHINWGWDGNADGFF